MKKKTEDQEKPLMGEDFPERIRSRRKALGWTGAELAEKSGVSTSWISLIESGQKIPSEEAAARIAEALGENVDEFRIWAGKSRAGARTQAWIDQLEGWHRFWSARLPRNKAAGEGSPDTAAESMVKEPKEAAYERDFEKGSPAPAGAGLRFRDRFRGLSDSLLRAPSVHETRSEIHLEESRGPEYQGGASLVPTVPLVDAGLLLPGGKEASPRAVIGQIPLDVRALQGTSGHLIALELSEESASCVTPLLSAGDLVVVDLEDREIPDTGKSDLIFLIRTLHGTLLSRCGRRTRFLILTPEDPSKVPEVLEFPTGPPGESPVLGRVVWSARRHVRPPA